jgi:hypothetical protein
MMNEYEKTDEQKADDFIAEYKALCEKHGLMINVTPVWKQSMDTGDWRLVIQTNVQKLQGVR